MTRRVWRIAAVALVGTACARGIQPGPPGSTPVDRRDDVERLIRAGCYRCLRDALVLVDEGHAVERRFDVLALLASRVREVGVIDEVDWRARAESAAPADDARTALILAVVDQKRQPQGGRVFDQLDVTPARRDEIEIADSAVWPATPSDPVDRYFFLTLRCTGLISGDASLDGKLGPNDSPLIGYRRATCGRVEADALDELRVAEPRFSETHYFSALAALNAGRILATERALEAFAVLFPRATAADFLHGQVLLALEEFEPAAEAFARVLRVMPSMPEALLYHMRTESQVDPARGEAAANRLVSLGTWHQGEAYYWRAWNRRALKRLDEAAADIETAKRVLYNAAVPKLAGFIAYERGDMPLAEAELVESMRRDASDCEVQFAIGQVLIRTRRWPEAATRFVSTVACSRTMQEALSRRLTELPDAELDPARRGRLEARIERQRAAERAREGLATYSAASALAVSGRPAEARPLAESALNWPDLRVKAEQLLTQLPR